MIMRRLPGAGGRQALYFGHRYRHGDDHDRREHLDHLLRHDRVDRQAALRDGSEQERRERNAGRMIPSDERHRDPEESCAGGEAFFVVLLVAEDVVATGRGRQRPPARARNARGRH